ncbi:MAG: aminotransferase class I/II-fold pyridoxal phosphate-dependent enzyme, partial [Candidatus Heimdallarchaeota archaeon]
MTKENAVPSDIQGHLAYRRTPIEKESPEEYGYDKITYNLAESSVPDLILGSLGLDLSKLALSYGDHLGNSRLRQAIAAEGNNLTPDQILITAGAAGALFIITTSLLKPKDHVVVLHPNYVANLESPRAIGCQIDYLRLRMEEDQFQIDLRQLEKLISSNTRLVSLTYPQNPTGMMLDESELKEIISLVESEGAHLLLDETYRDMIFNRPLLPTAASLSSKAISVSSFSKSYGLPGIRLGWLMTQDSSLMETFLAAKELIFICNSLVDEEIGAQFFISKKKRFLAEIQKHVETNFRVMEAWMKKNSYLEWIKPHGGCVC